MVIIVKLKQHYDKHMTIGIDSYIAFMFSSAFSILGRSCRSWLVIVYKFVYIISCIHPPWLSKVTDAEHPWMKTVQRSQECLYQKSDLLLIWIIMSLTGGSWKKSPIAWYLDLQRELWWTKLSVCSHQWWSWWHSSKDVAYHDVSRFPNLR